MIMVVKPEKPFTYTGKDTVRFDKPLSLGLCMLNFQFRRHAILNDYAEEIKQLYATVEESTQVNVTPPAEWSTSSATEFVRKIVGKVLVKDVDEYDDLFQHGCDRLVEPKSFEELSLTQHSQSSSNLDPKLDIRCPPCFNSSRYSTGYWKFCIRLSEYRTTRVFHRIGGKSWIPAIRQT
jgi:hypothetical protein